MRIFLDDLRHPADVFGYTYQLDMAICRTAKSAMQTIVDNGVTWISFDHDLGDGNGTGYDVACLIESRAAEGIEPPEWYIHSANPVGRNNIRMAMENAVRLYRQHQKIPRE